MSTAKEKTVKIGAVRKTDTVELPSIQGSKVTIYKALLVSEQRQLQDKYPDPSALTVKQQTEMSLYMLTIAIKEWNMVGEDDKPLPISNVTFDQLTLPDILKMLEVCTGQKLLDEENRPLSATSPALGKKVLAS